MDCRFNKLEWFEASVGLHASHPLLVLLELLPQLSQLALPFLPHLKPVEVLQLLGLLLTTSTGLTTSSFVHLHSFSLPPANCDCFPLKK